MIRFRDKVFENYFIDPVTAVITDENGIVQPTYIVPSHHYLRFKGMDVHQIQAHTAYRYIEGYDVHHKDENIFNNALSNLVYIPHEVHLSITGKNKAKNMTPEQYAQWIQHLRESHIGQVPVKHAGPQQLQLHSGCVHACHNADATGRS